MKKNSIRNTLCIIILFIMIMPVQLFAIEINSYIGDIKIIRKGKNIKPGKGIKIESGDIIRTGELSMVVLEYNDKSRITVGAESTVIIGHKTIKESDDISLVYGSLSGKYSKLKKGKRKIYTPTVVCAIRGTEFDIGVDKGGTSRIDLKQGNVRLNNPYGSRDMRPGQKTRTEVSQEPDSMSSSDDIKTWRQQGDTEFEKNPDSASKGYHKYMETFRDRSEASQENIKGYRTSVKSAKDSGDLEKTGQNIDEEEESIQDDLFLNQASYHSISDVLNDYRSRNKKIYRLFLKIKKESNKVKETQEQNYRQIQAVKAAYKEAYEKIMGKFKEDREKILKGVDMDSVKPKIKN